jgi:hypothetical protein
MARIGYGYSKAKKQLVGRDYAQALGKNLRSGESLQLCGLDSLLQTTLGGECSVAIPVSSTLKILLGLFW